MVWRTFFANDEKFLSHDSPSGQVAHSSLSQFAPSPLSPFPGKEGTLGDSFVSGAGIYLPDCSAGGRKRGKPPKATMYRVTAAASSLSPRTDHGRRKGLWGQLSFLARAGVPIGGKGAREREKRYMREGYVCGLGVAIGSVCVSGGRAERNLLLSTREGIITIEIYHTKRERGGFL